MAPARTPCQSAALGGSRRQRAAPTGARARAAPALPRCRRYPPHALPHECNSRDLKPSKGLPSRNSRWRDLALRAARLLAIRRGGVPSPPIPCVARGAARLPGPSLRRQPAITPGTRALDAATTAFAVVTAFVVFFVRMDTRILCPNPSLTRSSPPFLCSGTTPSSRPRVCTCGAGRRAVPPPSPPAAAQHHRQPLRSDGRSVAPPLSKSLLEQAGVPTSNRPLDPGPDFPTGSPPPAPGLSSSVVALAIFPHPSLLAAGSCFLRRGRPSSSTPCTLLPRTELHFAAPHHPSQPTAPAPWPPLPRACPLGLQALRRRPLCWS